MQVLGRGIQVWWVDDARYYHGTINAYDVPSGKHRVSDDDPIDLSTNDPLTNKSLTNYTLNQPLKCTNNVV